jgi:hypothetical protein
MVARVIFSAYTTKQPPEKYITISMYDVYTTLYVYKNLRPLMSLNICIDFFSLSRCLCVCACVCLFKCAWCAGVCVREGAHMSFTLMGREWEKEERIRQHPFRVTCKEVRVRSRRPFFSFSFSYVRRRRRTGGSAAVTADERHTVVLCLYTHHRLKHRLFYRLFFLLKNKTPD